MKRRVRIAGVLAAVVCLTACARAADKIAVVDLGKVMDAYGEARTAEDLLEKLNEEYEKEKAELVEQLKTMEAEYKALRQEATAPMLSDGAKEKKKELLRDKEEELLRSQQEIGIKLRDRKRELSERRVDMTRRLVKQLVEKIRAYAEDKGFTLVLDSTTSVIYAADTLDITDQIVEVIAGEEKK